MLINGFKWFSFLSHYAFLRCAFSFVVSLSLGNHVHSTFAHLLVRQSCFWYCHNTAISTRSYYNDNNDNLPVIMSNVYCEGNESRLVDCSYTTGGGSGSHVSLRCSYDGKYISQALIKQPSFNIIRFLH